MCAIQTAYHIHTETKKHTHTHLIFECILPFNFSVLWMDLDGSGCVWCLFVLLVSVFFLRSGSSLFSRRLSLGQIMVLRSAFVRCVFCRFSFALRRIFVFHCELGKLQYYVIHRHMWNIFVRLRMWCTM